MPGLLIHLLMNMTFLKKYKKVILLWIMGLSVLVLIILNNIWAYAIFAITLLLLFVNWYVYRLSAYNVTHLFSTIGRNYKRVVIGESFDERKLEGKENDTIAFLSPTRRSPLMTLEMVKRLYSLLDESDGELVIVLRNHKDNINNVSVFDIPFLHEVTLNSLGLSWMKLKSRFPIIFEPLASGRVLFGYKPDSDIVEARCPFSDISDFCLERNIKLRFFYIQP